MASGKIKWFDNKRGFGFILQDSGQDVFVHHKNIEGEGFKTLYEGDIVRYEVVQSERGPKAEHVQRVQNAKRISPVQRDSHRSIQSYIRKILR